LVTSLEPVTAGGSYRECGGLSDTPQSYNVICNQTMGYFNALKQYILFLNDKKNRPAGVVVLALFTDPKESRITSHPNP
ncbi:MAG: hypothetical protein ACOY46_06780, partial [Bacillota bacterium]